MEMFSCLIISKGLVGEKPIGGVQISPMVATLHQESSGNKFLRRKVLDPFGLWVNKLNINRQYH